MSWLEIKCCEFFVIRLITNRHQPVLHGHQLAPTGRVSTPVPDMFSSNLLISKPFIAQISFKYL